jgi:hypothetical protein
MNTPLGNSGADVMCTKELTDSLKPSGQIWGLTDDGTLLGRTLSNEITYYR